ncbi:MAG: methylated-DNA--[Oscillospiraceae bacterium]|nr:methylated-DNA--[protein]-cysteine S-methyltransferase [Oscillospiraceae bacterium]
MYFAEYPSPLGTLLLTCEENALTGLWMQRRPPETGRREDHPVLKQAMQWLDGYFRGEVQPVLFPLNPEGTPFQKQVWQLLLTIPYGTTRSYGDIAQEMAGLLGKEKMSAQAVGQAVGKNPISILIPCHRVVGAKGQLTGYAGGRDKKVWLLRHEGWKGAEK